MWRYLQNIPRVVKKSVLIRPVANCTEEEKECVHHANKSVQSNRLTHSGAVLCHLRNTWTPQCCDQKSQKNGNQKDGFHKFWSTIDKNNTVEAVGLGAIIVICLQLGRFQPRKAIVDEEGKNKYRYCVFYWINKLLHDLQLKPSYGSTKCILQQDDSLKFENIIKKYDQISEEVAQNPNQPSNDFTSDDLVQTSHNDLQFEASIDTLKRISDAQIKLEEDETCKSNTSNTTDSKPPSLDEAGEKWIRLADKLNSQFQNQTGVYYANNGKTKEAMEVWSKCANYDKAQFNIGVCYENGLGVAQDMQKAFQYYTRASIQGHSMAKYNLAMMYLEGRPGIKKNPSEAFRLLQYAATSGLNVAQVQLGVLYTENDTQDVEKAAEYFSLAAKQKDKDGLFYLGICYENGLGVNQNLSKAAELYTAASKAGHPTAQYNLAAFYEEGIGDLPQNLHTAADMYEKAALLGENGAEQKSKYLRKRIEQLEIEKLRSQIKEYKFGRSRSTPAFPVSPPLTSQYLQANFAFADMNFLRLESEPSDLDEFCERDISDSISGCSTDSFDITFQLGADEEDFSDNLLYLNTGVDMDSYTTGVQVGLSRSSSAPMLEMCQ